MTTIVVVGVDGTLEGPDFYVVDNKELTEEENKVLDYWVKQNEKGISNADCSLRTPYDKASEEEQKHYDIFYMTTGYGLGEKGQFKPGKFKKTDCITPYLKNVTRLIKFYDF